jgi:hypothetical protein
MKCADASDGWLGTDGYDLRPLNLEPFSGIDDRFMCDMSPQLALVVGTGLELKAGMSRCQSSACPKHHNKTDTYICLMTCAVL